MPTYLGEEILYAEPAFKTEDGVIHSYYDTDVNWQAIPEHTDGHGYKIAYPDGRFEWKRKDEFESNSGLNVNNQ